MTKIYCDICGKELRSVTYLKLPQLWSGEVVTSSDPYELCTSCARHIYQIVDEYKEIMKSEREKKGDQK